MKTILKSKMSGVDIEEMMSDDEYECNDNKVGLSIKKVKYFLDNYDNLSKKDYYKMICNFYMIELEDSDYIDYINYKNNSNYDRVIRIDTNVIIKDIQSEGHGRDFSWWTVSYHMYLKVAVLGELKDTDKYFTIDEIKKLIRDGKVYPIDYFCEECDDRLYENRVKNDIDYLVKFERGRQKGQLSINDEYFDYFIDKIIDSTLISDMFKWIRSFIIDVRANLERYLDDYYFCENKETKDKLRNVNELIDKFNEKISSLDKVQGADGIEMISKEPIKRVMKYLRSLSNDDENKRYKDITLEWVLSIISSLEYDENKELCDEIEKIVFDLGEANLCYDMIYSADWIDNNKLISAIINSGDDYVCYEVLINLEVDEVTRGKLVQVIIDSGYAELNYNLAKSGLDFIDVREHGKVVIDSKNVWYNFLFAQLDGADVRAHGEVVMKYGTAYDNESFCCYVTGADVEKHREIIRIKSQEEKQESENKLKRVKTKK